MKKNTSTWSIRNDPSDEKNNFGLATTTDNRTKNVKILIDEEKDALNKHKIALNYQEQQ